MTVRILTPEQKKAVVAIYSSNMKPKSINELAYLLNVSTRTISRTIEEAGLIPSKKMHTKHTGEAAKVMQVLYNHKLNSDDLEAIINTPALIPSNVSNFLRGCTQEQLYVLFAGAGLVDTTNPVIRNMAAQALMSVAQSKPIPNSAQLSLVAK